MSQDRPNKSEHPREMISAYLDGQLDAADRVRVFEHLRDCDACRWLLSDYRALASAARREAAPPAPADLADRIGRRIGADAAARFGWRQRLVAARLPLATAAAVLVLASLWIVWRGRLPGEPATAPPPGEILEATESATIAATPATGTASASGPATVPEPAPPAAALPVVEAPPIAAQPPPAAHSSPAPAIAMKTRADGVWREEAASVPAPAPAPPARMAASPSAPMNKDQRPARQRERLAEEEAPGAAPTPSTLPPPAENRELAAVAGTTPPPAIESGVVAQGTGADAAVAPVPAASGPAPSVATREADRQTAARAATGAAALVFVTAEGRVTVLPDSRVVLASGGYLCTVSAGGPAEEGAFAEMRLLAAGRAAPAGSPSTPDGAPATPVGEILIPAPPAIGSLPADVAGSMHLRLRALLRDGILPRAEAQCGALPPALQQYR